MLENPYGIEVFGQQSMKEDVVSVCMPSVGEGVSTCGRISENPVGRKLEYGLHRIRKTTGTSVQNLFC